MRKTLLLLTLLSALPLMAADVPHRLVYGYFLTNKSTADYGLGRFYMDDPQNIEIVLPGDGAEGWFAGACANGIYYACTYRYSITEGPLPSGFISIDLATGEQRTIGTWSEEDYNPYFKLQDMTYDYSTGTMYAVGFEMGKSRLYTFDLTTGKPTEVAPLSLIGFGAIACSYDGRLYGFNANDASIYLINKTTGQCVKLLEMGEAYQFAPAEITMDFDHTTGQIYLADRSSKLESRKDFLYLVRINVTEPMSFEDVAQVGDDANLQALYIPYVLAGEDAPAAPTSVSIEPAPEGVTQVELTWTTPTMTFGGAPLSGLDKVIIHRDGEVIATLDAAGTGVAMSYTDRDVADGQHLYVVSCTNEVGEGEAAQRFAYVGRDCPDEAQNISVTVGDGCQSATITWTDPVRGYHGGYFTTDGLTFSVRRYPDLVMVAEGLTDHSCTDTSVRRLAAYSYEVIAQNPYGQTGQYTPYTYVLGTPIDLQDGDFVEDFYDRTRFQNQWTEWDANGDYYSWVYNTMAPQQIFGSSEPGAVYFLNPGIYNPGHDADEWLISPPLRMQPATEYKVVLHARSLIDEDMTVTFGLNNQIDGQQALRSLVIDRAAFNTDGIALYTDYEVALPVQSEETVGCVGIHLTTPLARTDNYSMLQINSITVKEGAVSAIRQIENDTFSHSVYDLQGRPAGNPLGPGLYIIDGKKHIIK